MESTINQVVSKRFVKKQQMQWTCHLPDFLMLSLTYSGFFLPDHFGTGRQVHVLLATAGPVSEVHRLFVTEHVRDVNRRPPRER